MFLRVSLSECSSINLHSSDLGVCVEGVGVGSQIADMSLDFRYFQMPCPKFVDKERIFSLHNLY